MTYKSGRQDVNAPDLYIGVNSFITYVLIVLFSLVFQSSEDAVASSLASASTDQPLVNGGTRVLTPGTPPAAAAIAQGVRATGAFNPDKMYIIMSRSAITWAFNFLAMRVALYLTNSSVKAAILDLVSYSGARVTRPPERRSDAFVLLCFRPTDIRVRCVRPIQVTCSCTAPYAGWSA